MWELRKAYHMFTHQAWETLGRYNRGMGGVVKQGVCFSDLITIVKHVAVNIVQCKLQLGDFTHEVFTPLPLPSNHMQGCI